MRIATTIFFTVLFAPWIAGFIIWATMGVVPPSNVTIGIICLVSLVATWHMVAEKMKKAFPKVNHTMDRAAMRRLSTR